MRRSIVALFLSAACQKEPDAFTLVDGEVCFPASGVFYMEPWPRDGISAYDVAWDMEYDYARKRDFASPNGASYQANIDSPGHILCVRGRALVMHDWGTP